MPGTLTWVIVGIGLYTVALLALRARGSLPESVKVSGPIVTLHTQRGREFLDRLAQRRRFWRAWGNVGVGIALVVMALSAVVVVVSALSIASQPERALIESPQNALVIPGVNKFLPLSAAPDIVFGLALGMIAHEGGHGLLCRVEDIDIDSMGLAMFAFIPIGAFVEPDEQSRNEADRGAQTRMFAAGVTNNFAITALVFALLFGPIAASIGVAPGVPVGDTLPGSAAADAELSGTVITSVNGTDITNRTELEQALDRIESATLSVGLREGETRTVERRLLVTDAVPATLSGLGTQGEQPLVVQRVNGTSVATEQGFVAAVRDRPVVRLGTNQGTVTLPIGAYVAKATPGGPLAAKVPADTPFVITRLGGTRITNRSRLGAALERAEPGSTTGVVVYVEGERREVTVELGERNGSAVLGVSGVPPGYTGMVFDEMGIKQYPAGFFLSALDGSNPVIPNGAGPFAAILVQVVLILYLPLASLATGSFFNFAGFTGGVANFYVVQGPLGFLGGGVFLLANVCFWTGWVNFNLALFNCIPAFPLDGGHILRTSTEAVVSRLPVPNRRTVASAVTTIVTLSMIGALLLMFLGPQLLS